MRADQLPRIRFRLQGHGPVSASTLTRELDISTRTPRHDMEALSAAGVPVYATRGCTGGWRSLAATASPSRQRRSFSRSLDSRTAVRGSTHGSSIHRGTRDRGDAARRWSTPCCSSLWIRSHDPAKHPQHGLPRPPRTVRSPTPPSRSCPPVLDQPAQPRTPSQLTQTVSLDPTDSVWLEALRTPSSTPHPGWTVSQDLHFCSASWNSFRA